MPNDVAGDQIRHCLNFFWQTGGVRKPPDAVVDYVRLRKDLPDLKSLVAPFT